WGFAILLGLVISTVYMYSINRSLAALAVAKQTGGKESPIEAKSENRQPNNDAQLKQEKPPSKPRHKNATEQPLPRIPSPDQIATLKAGLELAAGNPVFIQVVTENDPETQEVGKQIIGAFQNAKWVIRSKITGHLSRTIIGEPDAAALNPEAGLICTAPSLDT